MENHPQLTIYIFGQLTDVLGSDSIAFPMVSNSTELKLQLEMAYPSLKGKTYKIAVNKKFDLGEQPISVGDEIALMPPFSGG